MPECCAHPTLGPLAHWYRKRIVDGPSAEGEISPLAASRAAR